ncbi:MAG: hypothetical protein Q4F85_11700 [Prevotella sp.]|nr:hypothetical protein [Prevotella sp.]
MSNTKKEEMVYDVLTRYGITDRRVAITIKNNIALLKEKDLI